jgi:uncharacterized LabA/DUF88 family protein/cold shock CspA family protein
MKDKLKRIGVFYDGNYFFRVSSYYAYGHERKSRLSISGLHDFVKQQVAVEEDSDPKLCQIVDAHYFRGRLSAAEASQRGDTLYWDRVFDDILMSEGVTTHYLPVKTVNGEKQEKGIDVLLAVEALETAFYKKFDVVVLIASDGDYVPLIRKLNTLGTRVMVLSWDFEYTDDQGRRFTTRTSQDLLEEVSYPIAMHEIINNRLRKNEPLINNMFVQSEFRRQQAPKAVEIVDSFEYPTTYPQPLETISVVQTAAPITPNIVLPTQTVAPITSNIVLPTQTVAPITSNIVLPTQTAAPITPNTVLPTQTAAPITPNIILPTQTVAPITPNTVLPTQTVATVNQNISAPVENTVETQPNIVLPTSLNAVADLSAIIQPFANSNVYHKGEVLSLKTGFGFIKFPPNNLFFHHSDVKGVDFNELQPGDKVEFVTGVKENGQGYATNIKLVD